MPTEDERCSAMHEALARLVLEEFSDLDAEGLIRELTGALASTVVMYDRCPDQACRFLAACILSLKLLNTPTQVVGPVAEA